MSRYQHTKGQIKDNAIEALLHDVNATMFDRYLPFSCPLNTFVTDAVRFPPFHHH
ncbi:IS600 ORF2 [Shigella sonnei]|nr:IS600 ORF2 [Shigella sonnei]SJC19202.1 IS600 ORF2 [Shigella sonnei]SRI80885.1 IS600 ORF2 [Shigella sonnei]SRS30308.1 IS600 ORF2 [Shigella sonnei]SVI83328.1 IS600 ORF2 [Shigella sonnei]